jgi:methylmalonyl-CoA epimerase
MLGDKLAYVALAVRDTDPVVQLFEKHLELPRTNMDAGGDEIAVFSIGESSLAVFPLGHPYLDGFDKPGVHHIALAAKDLNVAVKQTEDAGVATVSGERHCLGGGTRIAIDSNHTASVRTWVCQSFKLPRSQSSHVERIDHLGIASADNRTAVEAWCTRLRRPLESQQTDLEVSIAVESFTSDKYGVVYHTREPEPVGGLRVAFITVGDCDLEFLQNFDPRHSAYVEAARAGTTRQDQGAITKFIASRGAGLHHVAFRAKDINRTLAALDRAGIPVIDHVGRPGSRRAQIGFVHPRGVGGVLVHFVQRD